MPTSFGLRARTRDKFSKAYKTKGMPGLSRYLTCFKRGDIVDIKADPSIQAGMPYNFYHGRTGVVFNVTKSALGVQMKKKVGNHEVVKRLHVCVEHVRKSRCNEAFIARVKANDKIKFEAKQKGEKADVKRKPEAAKPGKIIRPKGGVQVMEPQPFVENYF